MLLYDVQSWRSRLPSHVKRFSAATLRQVEFVMEHGIELAFHQNSSWHELVSLPWSMYLALRSATSWSFPAIPDAMADVRVAVEILGKTPLSRLEDR